MTTLFDGELHVHYGFINVFPEGGDPPSDLGRSGQVNGLCGAAEPGALSLITGLHTGAVPFRLEVHEAEPPPGDEWEDVVEASFTTTAVDFWLATFDDGHEFSLPRPGTYRARYSASGMDAANEQDSRMDGEPAFDRYLLQLWPGPAAPDAVVREGSERARYWHGVARETPPEDPNEPREVPTADVAGHE